MTSIDKANFTTNCELMIIPFRRAAEFLDLESIRNLLLLNKIISKSLITNDFAGIIVPRILKRFYEEPDNNIIEFYSQKFSPVFSYKDILTNIRRSENLIKNPFGSDGLNKWIIEENGDNWQCIANAKLSPMLRNKEWCFTSTGTGSLKQVIKFSPGFEAPILWFGAVIIPSQNSNVALHCSFINDDGTINQETIKTSKPFEVDNLSEKFDIVTKIPRSTIGAEITVFICNNYSGIQLSYIFARVFETNLV